MKLCVISLAKAETRSCVLQLLDRLEKSLGRVKFKGDLLFWRDRYPANCPSHLEVPFAFKPLCFLEAKAMGYDLVLWLDASIIALRPIEPLFEKIRREGYLIFKNPLNCSVGQWCSDEALQAFPLDREDALKIPELSAAVMGLDLRNELALNFLNQWHAKALEGVVFRGVKENGLTQKDYDDIKWNKSCRASPDSRVKGHRHDQTAAGIIAHQLEMKLSTEEFEDEDTGNYPRIREKQCLLFNSRNMKISAPHIFLRAYFPRLVSLWRRIKRYGLFTGDRIPSPGTLQGKSGDRLKTG